MITISREWTDTDRLAVIALLANLQMDKAQETHGAMQAEPVYRIAERIGFVARMSPAFLEANRTQILEGFKVSP